MQEVRASYELTAQDLLEAQTRDGGLFLKVGWVVGAFMILIGAWGTFVYRPLNFGPIATLLAGLAMLFRGPLSGRLSFQRDFAKLGKMDLLVSSSGVQFLTANGTTDLAWSAFTHFVETRHLFTLYIQSNIFNIVPKRAFAPDDLVLLRQILVEQHLGAKSAAYNNRISPQMIFLLAVIAVVAVLVTIVIIR